MIAGTQSSGIAASSHPRPPVNRGAVFLLAAMGAIMLNYGSCSSFVRHEAYCYIARKAGRDERRLSLDLMPNQSPKGRYGKIAWQKTSGRA
jgi:hypothetical protein